MKNLKKVLSLALAFAMVLGLCVGAMAADTQDVTKLADWAEVTHKEAAQLLNAFGIMSGDNQGFRPADPVTRAEAAKMIMVTVWGGVDNAELFKDTAIPFTDIKGVTDWATGYIAAAYGYGIISGRNATTFDPKGNVTGYELLKMVLTALGYNAECAGLVGANWDLNAMLLAKAERNETDLTKGVEVTNWAAAINRENAAQVIANMVSRHTVKYNKTNDENVVESDKYTFGKAVLKLETVTGTLVANAYGKVTNTTEYTVKDATKYNSVVLTDAESPAQMDVNTTSGLYDLGAKVVVYTKGEGDDATPLSVVIDTPVEVASDAGASSTQLTVNVGTVAEGTTHAVVKYLDTTGDGKINVTTTVNYGTAYGVTNVVESEKHGTVYVTGTGAWRDTYEKSNTLPSALLTDVVFVGDAAEKGDYIAFAETKNAVSGDDNVKVAVVLTTGTGTVGRIGTDGTYYVDGAAHKAESGVASTLGFGKTGTFYFYPDNYIAKFDEDTGSSTGSTTHYAVIYKAGYTATGASTSIGGGVGTVSVQVAAILDNGESHTYNLVSFKNNDDPSATLVSTLNEAGVNTNLFGNGKMLEGVGVTGGVQGNTNALVEYTLTDDGIRIVEPAATNVATVDNYIATENSAKFAPADGSNPKYFTNTTVTFISNGENDEDEAWTVYTGIPTSKYTVTTGKAVTEDAYNADDGLGIKAMFINGVTATGATTDTSAFVYILENKGQTGVDDADNPIYTMTVYDAAAGTVGDVEVRTVTGVDDPNDVEPDTFYASYTASTKTLGAAKMMTGNTYAQGFIATCGNGVVVLTTLEKNSEEETKVDTSNVVFTYNTDTKFYLIDGEDSKAITAADVDAQTVDAYGTDGNEHEEYYQAIIELTGTSSTTAAKVIVFGDRQGTPAAE